MTPERLAMLATACMSFVLGFCLGSLQGTVSVRAVICEKECGTFWAYEDSSCVCLERKSDLEEEK